MADHAMDWQARCPFWPQEVANRYREAGIWRYETFFDLLARQAGRLGRRIALIDGERQIRYDRLHRDALALAGGLSALGLVRGDRVVVQFPNCAEFVTLFFALCRLGVVPVLALPGHRDLELGQFADFTGARAILTAQEPEGYDMVALARRVQDKVPSVRHVVVLGDGRDATPFDSLFRPDLPLLAGPNAEDVACFQISGGTTGVPKLIPRRHMEYLYNIRMAVAASGLDGDTRYLCVLPMMHNFPMACPGFLGTLQAGGTVVVAPEPEAGICFDLIAPPSRHGDRTGAAAGAAVAGCAGRAGGGSVRAAAAAGGRCHAEPVQRPAHPARAGLPAAAGLRHGRGAGLLYRADRQRRAHREHPGPADVALGRAAHHPSR